MSAAPRLSVIIPWCDRAELLRTLTDNAAIFERHEGLQSNEPGAHYNLARALIANDGDRVRAREQLDAAIEGFRTLGHPDLGEAGKFLDEHFGSAAPSAIQKKTEKN